MNTHWGLSGLSLKSTLQGKDREGKGWVNNVNGD